MSYPLLDGIPITLQKYQVESKVKQRIYNLPHSYLDAFLNMRSYNRTHTMDVKTVFSQDTETLLNSLDKPVIVFIDLENVEHLLVVTSMTVNHQGGQVQIYSIHLEAIETYPPAPLTLTGEVSASASITALEEGGQVSATVVVGYAALGDGEIAATAP
jgi:hypothetical protein